MCHLLRATEHKFLLIKQIFKIILNDDKINYMWDDSGELVPLSTYELFNNDQLALLNIINFQLIFQEACQKNHPHQTITTPSSDLSNECLCEQCIGLSPSNPWRLQNAVAFQLHEWLDKRLTRSTFYVGLHPELWHMNDREQEYRKQLVTYASYDCLAIQHLLIQHELIQSSKKTTTTTTTFNEQTENEREITSGLINRQPSIDLSPENNPDLIINSYLC